MPDLGVGEEIRWGLVKTSIGKERSESSPPQNLASLGPDAPGYFARLVTGIVPGLPLMARFLPGLFWMNIRFALILWCLSLLRLTFSLRRVLDDLQSHSRAWDFSR